MVWPQGAARSWFVRDVLRSQSSHGTQGRNLMLGNYTCARECRLFFGGHLLWLADGTFQTFATINGGAVDGIAVPLIVLRVNTHCWVGLHASVGCKLLLAMVHLNSYLGVCFVNLHIPV